jgi:hypothetical protein
MATDWNKGTFESLGRSLRNVLSQLVLLATGTSTEGLIPKARQLVAALTDDPQAAEQIDAFRLLVAKQSRTPNEVKL